MKEAVAVLVAVALVYWALLVDRRTRVKHEADWQVKLETAISTNYSVGFWDGVQAAGKWMRVDPQSGKFTLELTNVMAEMRR